MSKPLTASRTAQGCERHVRRIAIGDSGVGSSWNDVNHGGSDVIR